MTYSSEKGFSLIEVLISILLISLVVIASMLSYRTTMRTSNANTLQNNAIRLAQQTIEAIKQYDQLADNRQSPLWTSGVLNTQNVTIDGINYTVSIQIISTNDLNTNFKSDFNYIPIRVIVNWNYLGPNQIVVDTCLITII